MRESSAPGKVTGIREDSRLLGGGGVPGLQGRRQKEHPHGCRLCHLLGTRDEACPPMGGIPRGGADTGAGEAKADVCSCAWKLPTLRRLLSCPQGQQRPQGDAFPLAQEGCGLDCGRDRHPCNTGIQAGSGLSHSGTQLWDLGHTGRPR